jgi:hypothetical protein
MGGRVIGGRYLIISSADNFSVANNDGAERASFATIHSIFRKSDGFSHVFFVGGHVWVLDC